MSIRIDRAKETLRDLAVRMVETSDFAERAVLCAGAQGILAKIENSIDDPANDVIAKRVIQEVGDDFAALAGIQDLARTDDHLRTDVDQKLSSLSFHARQ